MNKTDSVLGPAFCLAVIKLNLHCLQREESFLAVLPHQFVAYASLLVNVSPEPSGTALERPKPVATLGTHWKSSGSLTKPLSVAWGILTSPKSKETRYWGWNVLLGEKNPAGLWREKKGWSTEKEPLFCRFGWKPLYFRTGLLKWTGLVECYVFTWFRSFPRSLVCVLILNPHL